ncbi:MAG: DUF4830 domain-containing protein [Fournierella sp.]|uniref:DUF4830 domain-containing protein n=1 Tax=Allofournierella sp. TaxID=1940256 RepID=UPI002A834F0A|nr:DUF4830 domain-containing protein [Fournierella sp.]MDY4167964.1 DUF4830 domain-containing protein [Fournierella sp.]
MFVLTLGKKGLRRLGAAAVCGIALAGAVLAVSGFIHAGDGALEANASAAQSGATAIPEKIAVSEDIAAFFKGFGLEVDLTTATVDKVKVPKKWDESFSAFNTVVKESGFDLADSKGKTVEKWLVECPARSDGQNTCQCVLLVYKEKPVGAYLLSQPSGEVTGLTSAAATPAPLTSEQAAQTAAGFGEGAAEASADGTPQAASALPADSAAQQASGDEIVEFDMAQVGAEPVE